MRRFFFILCTCFMISNLYVQESQRTMICEGLYFQEIKDSVYMITHYFPGGGNSMFILLPDSQAVLIDTPFETSGTKYLLDWIDNNFGKLKITAIVTGFHQDNLSGNEYLISKGISVYGSDLTKKLIIEQGDDFKKFITKAVENNEDRKYYNSFKSLKFLPPTNIFSIYDGMILEIGDEIFEVYYPGESHAIDNTVVYLRNRKILFGGCMIKGLKAKKPGFMEHANMVEWPLSVTKVKQKFGDVEIVVPGHGDWGNAELITHFLNVLKRYNIDNKINAENIQKYYFDKAGQNCDALNSVYYRNVVKDTTNSSYFRVNDYYFSGQIEMEGVFSSLNPQMKDINFQTWLFCGQNIKEGKFTKWFKNGKKRFEGVFRNNIRDGKVTDFYDNGNKKYEGYYKNGIKDSKWTYWSEDGKKIYDAVYKLGEHITAKEAQYNYLLYLPKEYGDDPNKKWPLIVYLHGGSMRGNDLEKLKWYGLPKLIDEENEFPFIIVSPQCPEAKDWATDKWFMIVMNDLSNKYRILKERIYLTGVCMGGSGVWYLCSKYPDIFAAAAPIAGFTNYLNLPAKAEKVKHTPFWIFHSENDKIVPIKESEDMLNALNKCKGNVRSSFTAEGGHNVKYVTGVYRNHELYDWFMKYKKNQ